MTSHDIETHNNQCRDKQLRGISLEAVMEKRRLDQALNAKEFAVCAGLSYSTARNWFHMPGFPVFHGHIFWTDFVEWRAEQHENKVPTLSGQAETTTNGSLSLPPRATQILLDI
jgi:hypothetical protein